MNKAKLIVTRVFDSDRTPQDAFVRAILNEASGMIVGSLPNL